MISCLSSDMLNSTMAMDIWKLLSFYLILKQVVGSWNVIIQFVFHDRETEENSIHDRNGVLLHSGLNPA